MIKARFTMKLEQVEQKTSQLKGQLDRLGSRRLILFMMALGSLIVGEYQKSSVWYGIGIALLVYFIVLIRKYQKLEHIKRYEEARGKVIEKYIARVGNEWKAFDEKGEAYIGEEGKVKDLDLLGRSSLYQYVCVAHTPYGKRRLAKALTQGYSDKRLITQRQEAVRELIKDEAFSLHLQTLGEQMKLRGEQLNEVQLEAFIRQAEEQKVYTASWMRVVALVIPFITLFCGIAALYGVSTVTNYSIASIGATIQIGVALWNYPKNAALFQPIFAFNKNVGLYMTFLEALEQKTFESEYLRGLQARLVESGGAVKGLKSLNHLTGAITMRFNAIAYFVVNSFLMWDVHCKDALGLWNKQYGRSIRAWLEVIGEVECLLSLAVIGQVKDQSTFPEIIEERIPSFSFEQLSHPLIEESKVIGNSLTLEQSTCIITGSNMSGKTTFLRSIGVNLALAYAGAPVVATYFKASYMEVFTSMRIEDRVDEGISTFYAELLRIKEMIQFSESKQPMIVLVDEIFKGTNSADRILGATETIKKLGVPWANVMVTTHDFELCQLAEVPRGDRPCFNYHFEEYYKDSHIHFDYKMKKDRCQTTNAQFLLRMVGILD